MAAALLKPRTYPVVVSVVLGAMWRLWLSGRYAGWEESDYGNLAMIQGVVDGGFLHFDMNHMPGYYALAAVVHSVVNDAVLAGRSVSLVAGVVALGLATSLAVRIGGPRAGWVAGLLLVIQPEFSLYASSSLREPVAAAWLMGCLTLLGRERLALAGLCAAGAFLVRFDSALVTLPLMVAHAAGAQGGFGRMARAVAPLVVTVLLWSIYCHFEHGTFAFWSHSVAVNIETGLGADAEGTETWFANGSRVVVGLIGWLLPWRIGWWVWAGLGVVALAAARTPHGELRTASLMGVLMVGLWGGIGFVGQHEPNHNLYWKWLCPVIPVVIPLGVVGAWRLSDRIGRWAGAQAALLIMGLGVVQAAASNLKEAERQRARSEAWYRPQLELAQWVEREVAEEVTLLLDNIPACWIRRRPNNRRMVSWFDVPVPANSPELFAAWIEREAVKWVLWFREDWTQAPGIAPFLESGGTWSEGAIRLVETSREDGYGWILYEVKGPPVEEGPQTEGATESAPVP